MRGELEDALQFRGMRCPKLQGGWAKDGGSQTQAQANCQGWLLLPVTCLPVPTGAHSPLLFTCDPLSGPEPPLVCLLHVVNRRHPQSFYRITTLSLPRTHLPSIHSFCVTLRGYFPRGSRQVSSPRLLSRRPPFQHHQTALGIVDRASSSAPSRLLTVERRLHLRLERHTHPARHPRPTAHSHSLRPLRTRTAGPTHARKALHVSTPRCIGLQCDTHKSGTSTHAHY